MGTVLAVLLSCQSWSWSQNLDKLTSKEKVKVSGGLGFNTITYLSSGVNFPSREPFTWYASGNLNISILDVAFPFTYTYSNQGGKFTQPFNRTSLNPHYKWVKGTFGMTTMSFSPYTLTGHLFFGGGLELTPGKWKISFMMGRLNKAVAYDPIADNLNQLAYNRFGYGIKCGYENKGYGASLIVFKAKDNTASLDFVPLNTSIKPQDNLVLSAQGKASILKNLTVEAEYALSVLTQNLNDELESIDEPGMHKLIQSNATTALFQAYKGSVKYQLKWMNIGFNYEHIDPGYKTLGGYYFNNDLNNYTLAPSFTLFKKKLTLGANTGFQRNNLSGDKGATTSRWVGSLTASCVPFPQWVLNATYSNFSTFTRNRPNSDPFYFAPADTLNFYQLNQSASAMSSFSFGKSENKNAVQVMYSYQQSVSLSGNIQDAGAFGTNVESTVTGIPMDIHAANIAYSKQIKQKLITFTGALNLNRSVNAFSENVFFGPTVNVSKSLFEKKSTLTLGTTYNRQYTSDVLLNNVFNHRVSFTFSPELKGEKTGKLNLSLNANWLERLSLNTLSPNMHEVNIFINLNYSF